MREPGKSRREFLRDSFAVGVGVATMVSCSTGEKPPAPPSPNEPLFRISLAQWSLHRAFYGGDPGETMGWDKFNEALHSGDYRSVVMAGDLDPLDFPVIAKRDYGIEGVEYVNTMYFDKAKDRSYLAELKKRADDNGVRSVLIMCDSEGELGDPDETSRLQAVENHFKWVDAAEFLGCHAIRVNASSDAGLSPEEQQRLAADGLRRLCEYADPHGIDIVVENHGGLSSDASWLAGMIRLTDHPRAGTLPDFGNFLIEAGREYDRYKGVAELMPFARGVSAKSYDFDDAGDETTIDYRRMMKIVLDAGYHGFVGIEYEGTRLSEPDGIRATRDLLQRIRDELAPDYA